MVNNSDTKVSYQGNGQTTVFPFSFPFIQRDYIKVAIYDSLTEKTKTIDSDYYVDTVANTVIYPGYEPGQEPAEALRPPILPSTSTITIYRQTDVDQLTDLGEKYPLKDIENMADKITEIIQEQAETLGRAVKVPVGDPKTPEEKLADLQNYVSDAANSAKNAADSEAGAQRAAEAAATSEANAAESERLASGYADTATDAASRAEDSAISARAYNAPDYDNETTYQAGDVVTFTDGNSYRALQETTGNEPPNIIYWQKVTDYVGDDFFEVDEYGYIVPMDSPSHSRYWRVDQNGYIVPIEGGDGGYRPDTRSLSAEYLNVTNEGYIKHLRADDVNAQEVDADEMTAEVAAFNTLTANAVNAGTANVETANITSLPNWQEYLAESTGYGIVSGCEPTISGLTVTVGAGVVHLSDGTRKGIAETNITLDSADSTNPRIDLVYITSAGVVAKVTGTATASPSAPALPSGGISVCNVSVAAGAATGTLTDKRDMLPRFYNTGIVNVKDFGAVGDGVTDDTAAIQAAIDYAADIVTTTARVEFNKAVVFPTGDYLVTDTITVPATITIIPIGNVCIRFHAQTQESVCFSVLALSKDAKTQTQGMSLFSDSLGSLCITGLGTGQGLGIGIRLTYDDRYTNPCTVKIAGVICDWLYIGIKVDYVNQYFTQINRCVFRFCIIGIQIADADIPISNSGERFTIQDSLFSRCSCGVYNVKAALMVDFLNCSIDFCTTGVYSEREGRYSTYNFSQCHIEAAGERAMSSDDFHGGRGIIYINSTDDNKGGASFEQCMIYLYGEKRPDVLIHGVGRIDLSDVRYYEKNHIDTVGRGIYSNFCIADETCKIQNVKNTYSTERSNPYLCAPCFSVMPAFFTAADANVTIALNAVLSNFTVTKFANASGAVVQSALYDNKYVMRFTSTHNGYMYLTQNKYQRITRNQFGGVITTVLPNGLSVSNMSVGMNVLFYDADKNLLPYSQAQDGYRVAQVPPSIDDVKTAMDENNGKVISSYYQHSYDFTVPDDAFYYKAQIYASITGDNQSILLGGFYLFFYD